MEEEKKSYLQQRVYDLYGLTEAQCSVPLWIGNRPAIYQTRKWKDGNGKDCEEVLRDDNGNALAAPFPLFQADQKDNIRLYPYTLEGKLISYLRDTQPKYSEGEVEDLYYLTRLNPENFAEYKKHNRDAGKYLFPGGETKKGTYPFFPPKLFEAYQKKEHIETVILTEGYFKAMVASEHGMMVIGLGSITLYADQKTGQLYPDIVRFLNVVQPDNIVILYDGDCKDVSKDALKDVQNGQCADLSKRQMIFRSSLLNLRGMLLEFKNKKGEPCELFFAYNRKMRGEEDSPKAIDDLLVDEEYKEQAQQIADDLNHPGRPGVYFNKLDLRSKVSKVNATFNLSSPKHFYEEYAEQIGEHEFMFEGGKYRYSAVEKKLVTLLDKSLEDYIAIGSEIVLVTEKPVANTSYSEWEFLPRSDKVMNARFGEGTAKKLYLYKYYEDYNVCPMHENYSREIKNNSGYRFYNIYSPLPYQPEEGKWPHIEKLLRQLTKEYPPEKMKDNVDYYEMLLDWITLTYFKPFQSLPIIMFVSKERSTGKTSFLNLLKYIYGNNAVIGKNDLIMSNFNSLLAGKLIMGIDETTMGDNKEVGEKLKFMATAKTIHVEMKGKDKKEMPSFLKIVLCSNEVKKAVFIDKDEIRYWVMRVTPWTDPEFDPEFEKAIEWEVPAFLHFLRERYYKGKMYRPKSEHRMWFSPEEIYNSDLATMMSGTQSNFEGSLRNYLEEMFIDTERLYLEFTVQHIWENVPDAKRKDQQYIRNLISDMKGVELMGSKKCKMPLRYTWLDAQNNPNLVEGDVYWPKAGKQCRPFRFDAKYFTSQEEYEQLLKKCQQKESNDPPQDSQQQMEF